MGWKGVRNHLPSKGIGLWPSSKKSGKNALEANSRDQLGYFSNGSGQSGPPGSSAVETQLDRMFEQLRNNERDPKDAIGAESSMEYLGHHLCVDLENAELFVALEILQAPSIGEITRKGYVDGWKEVYAATSRQGNGVTASRQGHAAYIRSLVPTLNSDRTFFKKVYRYAFVVGKEPDQKALGLENALTYWEMLFSSPGLDWRTNSYNWLELWTMFLRENWTRSVNKDMWNQTLEFATRTLTDETLSFWSENAAWPSVIDDFVAWCHKRGIGKVEEEAAVMEVDY